MKAEEPWKSLGWQHPLWDIVRYALSLRGLKCNTFESILVRDKAISIDGEVRFPIGSEIVELFGQYMKHRTKLFDQAYQLLRTENEALRFCQKRHLSVSTTKTKTAEHHQSSKAVVATVAALAKKICEKAGKGINYNPQTRCVWCVEKALHVTARNMDGAIPGLANPSIVWEIKEYWGKTSGGSKMSDAVYECHLVGRELREFQARSGCRITHVVFVDGRDQWQARKSDLKRLLDLMNQGLIDDLFIGKEIESDWEPVLSEYLRI